jgi:hypothetical protein
VVVYNNFHQDRTWIDKHGLQHPISEMATAHRIYAARMLDRRAVECAQEDTARRPLKPCWYYDSDEEFETAELEDWLRTQDPNEWIQTTKLYLALMNLPEPVPDEDRDDPSSNEGPDVLPAEFDLPDAEAEAKSKAEDAMFYLDLNAADNPRQAVFRALGAASVCWEDLYGAGLFDSSRAVHIGDQLMEYLYNHGLPRE